MANFEPQSPQVPASFPESYRSHKRYHFKEHQADAIIRATTHQSSKKQRQATTIFKADEQEAITSSIATSFEPTDGNGLLDCLPLEVFQDVVLHCDMRSVFNIRQVSRLSREKVDSVLQYQTLVKHGLDLFRASLLSNVACNISLANCHELLFTVPCSLCGYGARYVHLPTWKRVCRSCLNHAPELHYIPAFSLKSEIQMAKEEMTQLTRFKPTPQLYFNRYRSIKTDLVSVSQAKEVVGYPRDRYIEVRFNRHHCSVNNSLSSIKMTTCAMPHLDQQGNIVDYWLSCEGCNKERHTEHLVHVNGDVIEFSLMSAVRSTMQFRVYDRDGFLEHFRWCEQAQVVWEEQREKLMDAE
ncbi:hypothetical protein ACHAP5_008191 [Fusarium lateritium]